MEQQNSLTFAPLRRGLWAVSAWPVLLGWLLGALLLVPRLRAPFALLWAAVVCIAMRLAFGGLTLTWAGGRFTLRRGTLFPVEYAFPERWVVQSGCLSTPLLRRMGCCVVVMRVPGRWFLLPALPAADYERLSRLVRR